MRPHGLKIKHGVVHFKPAKFSCRCLAPDQTIDHRSLGACWRSHLVNEFRVDSMLASAVKASGIGRLM
jgi:hypothetical protein